jgi:oxalate decarboxylase/phosphoglucose isomerase-like protein (cupin superfamily)
VYQAVGRDDLVRADEQHSEQLPLASGTDRDAPVAVAVSGGTLTLYDSKDPSCTATRYSAGQGFIEPANHIHIARNEGTKTVSLYAIYLGVPGQWRKNPTPLDAYVKAPGNCPASVK